MNSRRSAHVAKQTNKNVVEEIKNTVLNVLMHANLNLKKKKPVKKLAALIKKKETKQIKKSLRKFTQKLSLKNGE